MSDTTSDIDSASDWDELRFILKCVAPFATLVWAGTLFWTLTEDLRWTIPSSIVLSAIAAATLFGPSERVRIVWLTIGRVVAIAIAMAAIGCLLYLGVKATIALVEWIVMFPFRHPFLFFGGLLLLLFGAAGAAEEQKPKTRSAHGPPFPAETHRSAAPTQPKRRRKRKRKGWSIQTRIDVWERCQRRCYYCNEELESWRGRHMHLDHKKPFSKNGPDAKSNLVAACPCCNHEKHDKQLPGLDD